MNLNTMIIGVMATHDGTASADEMRSIEAALRFGARLALEAILQRNQFQSDAKAVLAELDASACPPPPVTVTAGPEAV